MTGESPPPARRFLSPLFLACAVIMLLAAVGLRPVTGALMRYYTKERIDLRKPLDQIDLTRIASFRPVTDLSLRMVADEDIGTSDWVWLGFRPEDDESAPDTALLVTYYSDPRDQVPHTPEVCYRQAGATIAGMRQIDLPVPGLKPEHPEVEARLLDIENRGVEQVLLYVFCCNGRFYFDREQVRLAIGLPGDKYVYFSKVEAVTRIDRDETYDDALQRCRVLLQEVLPVLVEEHFPRTGDLRP